MNDLNTTPLYPQMRGFDFAFIFAPIAFASLHWTAAQTYAHFCAPPGLHGYVVSFFNVSNPVCSYALQVMDISKYFYNQSWIFIGISTLGACKRVYEMCTKPLF